MKKFILLLALCVTPLINCTGYGYYCGNSYHYDDWDSGNQYVTTPNGSGFHVYGSDGYFGQGFSNGFYLD